MTTLDPGAHFLSEAVINDKYANYIPAEQRRESWAEVVDRYITGLKVRYADSLTANPALEDELDRARDLIFERKVLPSMRGLQFGGAAVRAHNARMFNCYYHPVDSLDVLREFLYLLLCGCGVGYSVQRRHVSLLPPVRKQALLRSRTVHVVEDSIEGWANALDALVQGAFRTGKIPRFNYSYVRKEGEIIRSTGARAPGPEPLRQSLDAVRGIFLGARGRQLTPLEWHEVVCFVSQCVRAGGVRRSSLICLFDRDDNDLLYCKSGRGWPAHLAAANNSAVFPIDEVTREEFNAVWRAVSENGTGEPAFIWYTDCDFGFNPCVEAALRPGSFCNLSTVNAPAAQTYEDVAEYCAAAALLGTMQAGFTDFTYLRPHIRQTTEEDALIGVSFTGIVGSIVEHMEPEELRALAQVVMDTNERVAGIIGVNTAARCTLVKPEGTSSCALGGVNPGIHAGFGEYWLRRVIIPAGSPEHEYIESAAPGLIHHKLGEKFAYLAVPIRAQRECATREEGALAFLERVQKFNVHWTHAGHRRGGQKHNVSATCNVKPEEWPSVGEWAWEHRHDYSGISFFPFDATAYDNLPFEEITEEEYERLTALVPEHFDFASIKQTVGKALEQEAACAGGACLL